MTIGSVLLQPQALARFDRFAYEASLVDDAVALAQILLLHPEWSQEIFEELTAGLEQLGLDIVEELSANTEQGLAALQALIAPGVNKIQGFAEQAPQLDTVGDALDFINAISKAVGDFIESISLDNIRALVAELLAIVFNRFGLSIDYLRSLISRVVDRVIELLAAIPAAATSELIALRTQIRRLLLRVKREIFTRLPTINISAEVISQQIFMSLRANGFEKIREKIACIVEKIAAVLGTATSIHELGSLASGSLSVGAAHVPPIQTGKQYCWYASWLYSTQRRGFWGDLADLVIPFYTRDEVWISEDGKQLILRRVGEDFDEVLYQSDAEINWYDAPQFNNEGSEEKFSFTGALSHQFMEDWTFITSLIVIFWKFAVHQVSAVIEPGNHVTHALLTGWNLTRVTGIVGARAPLTSWLRDQAGWSVGHRIWFDMFFQWASVIFGSIEGRHTQTNAGNQFAVWSTLLGDDALDAFFIHEVATLVQEGSLSIFTLINNDTTGYIDWSDETHTQNRKYVYPLVNLSVLFWGYIFNKCVIPIEQYSHPFEANNAGDYHKWWWGGAPAFGALGGVSGELLGWALSRSVSMKTLLSQLGIGVFKGWGTHIVANYYWKEGDTDGGRYNRNPAGVIGDFGGYPSDVENSPYSLPVPAGTTVFVGQANQGMFSHFWGFGVNILPQIYAYDFSSDFNDPLVAARDGTVVDYFDWIPDDINPSNAQSAAAAAAAVGTAIAGQSGTPGANTANDQAPGWNFIMIRHDDPFNRETPAQQAHDLGIAATANIVSYAIYGHGVNGSVRAAFGARAASVAPAGIIGTQVQQGEVIMWAGDTGVSFHNHLHMHVRVDPGGSLGTPAIVNPSQLAFYTIPFVFRDATHPFKENGILKRLTWYRSGD